MSKIVQGFVGAVAVTGVLSAAQFAFGGDLGQLSSAQSATRQTAVRQDVNRAAKADRPEIVRPLSGGHTIAVNLIGQSVLVRVSDGQPAQSSAPQSASQERAQDGAPLLKPATLQRKPTVACEPVVSVLTDVAKQLQPGRCVT
ncbi:hypothetical protein [Rhodopseudomonas sp. B29]|uniref:hypothetical protein n=1 Tax=Rhodopseudomonas sp. B29 TaxID=95607 RepID=UPI000347FEC5|nr:hypothetical protein [Rhodopseudomonas sp. B29]